MRMPKHDDLRQPTTPFELDFEALQYAVRAREPFGTDFQERLPEQGE